ncbi:MAG TPA: nuclear transport factor 2 family protein [Sphingomonas sp.]|nr:nuclear transport factor 2 family protein [Sphingomonas sp.]
MSLLLLALAAGASLPDPADRSIETADAAFWRAFNACDRTAMERLIAPDAEFYHDKTGLTVGRERVVASLMGGPCGTPGLHVRREAVAASVRTDPVPGYGAIVSGRHRFYAQRGTAPEAVDGEARFAVVWRLTPHAALMERILSYGHGAVQAEVPACEVALPPAALAALTGRYASPMGEIVVTSDGAHLHLASGNLRTLLIATGPHTFRAPDRALVIDFPAERVGRIRVRENGAVVAEGDRQR